MFARSACPFVSVRIQDSSIHVEFTVKIIRVNYSKKDTRVFCFLSHYSRVSAGPGTYWSYITENGTTTFSGKQQKCFFFSRERESHHKKGNAKEFPFPLSKFWNKMPVSSLRSDPPSMKLGFCPDSGQLELTSAFGQFWGACSIKMSFGAQGTKPYMAMSAQISEGCPEKIT